MAFLPLKILGGAAKGITKIVQNIKAKKEAKLDARVERALNQKQALASIGLIAGGGAPDVIKNAALNLFGASGDKGAAASKAVNDGTVTASQSTPSLSSNAFLIPVLLLLGLFFIFKGRR